VYLYCLLFEVLEVRASNRTGTLNIMEVLQSALADEYKTLLVALGGVFVLTKGKAHIHVMVDGFFKIYFNQLLRYLNPSMLNLNSIISL